MNSVEGGSDPGPARDEAQIATVPPSGDAWATGGGPPAAKPSTAAQPPTAGDTLGRYMILSRLGSGGMGTVLKAYDETLDRAIALKLLHADTTERHAERLRREAQAMAKLSHPNIVHVYDVGRAQGRWFIAMELVHGQTLREWQRADHGWRECVRVYSAAGEGLAAAHAVGLVHRDFKPDNCIVDDSGRPRVVDFGLVREIGGLHDGERATEAVDVTTEPTSLTRTGAVLGTLAYMPPEQLDGRVVDARSDQFGFCVSLYEALYGERPFAGDTIGPLMAALIEGRVRPPPHGVRVPARLRRALLRGLSAEPEDRWPTMQALLSELRRIVAPARVGAPIVVVGAGLLAVGAGLWQQAEVAQPVPEPCRGASAELDGLWDEDRRAEVKSAILATNLSYAPGTWDRVERTLDAHAAAWIDKHTEVCEATNVRGVQSTEVMDLRMQCLRSRRADLGQVVDVLSAANETRVRRAVDLVAGLRSVSRCDDVEALRADLPPPEDPAVARGVEEQRERLAKAAALAVAGDYDEGLAEVSVVVERSGDLAYPPLSAEALVERGNILERKGKFTEAEDDLERAYWLALEHGHEAAQARAALLLAHIVGIEQTKQEWGLWWGRVALTIARRRGDPAALGSALDGVGFVLSHQGKIAEALQHHRRGLVVREEGLGPRHRYVAASLANIANLLMESQEHEEALLNYRRALSISEDAMGPKHPRVATIVNNMGTALMELGQVDEALEHYRRALARWEDVLGAEHPNVAGSLANIGVILSNRGESDAALDHYRRALVIFDQSLGPSHPQVAQLLSNIGHTLETVGDDDEALASYQRSVAIFEQALGPDHLHLALPLENMGLLLTRRGDLTEATRLLTRALGILQQALGPDHPRVAGVLISMAEIAIERDDPATARDWAERARSILEAEGDGSNTLSLARFALARALWADRSQRQRAHALARAALATQVSLDGPEAALPRQIQAWLDDHPTTGGP